MHKATLKKMQRIEAIRKVAGTMPAWQVAEHFGIAEATLQDFCSRNDISLAYYHKHFTPDEKRYMLSAREQGARVSEIAAKIGRSEGAISAFLSNSKSRGYVV